ncbi:MAG TPA: multicopper oxidase domain-containing protein [Candidatus Kapabacteria bacterium]|nr:multicopper oxidase domain-containing protein [Candidatus Kapabacteria bacterium]
MVTRRNFIITSAAAIAALTLDKKNILAAERSKPLGAGNPLQIPTEISGGQLTVGKTSIQILSGNQTDILSINAVYPPPTIRVKKGDSFSAHILNNLSDDVVIHWHGLHVPSAMDGHPMNAVKTGVTADINYSVINRAGTYFYHSHTDMMTAEQVYRGLAGMFIIDDDEDKALPLPRGEFEVPLMISDKLFDSNNQLVYSPTMDDMLRGWLGDTIMVNGTPDPFLDVAPTLYRFRIVNASNSRIYKIALSDNSEFTVISGDGGLLEAPVKTTSCFLANAERLDILIDFSKYQQGSSITLRSISFSTSDAPPPAPIPAQGAALDILRFDVTKTGDSKASIPAILSSIVKYLPADSKTTRTFGLTSSSVAHAINGKTFVMDRIDTHVPFNTLETWKFFNASEHIHPMHVHATQFQVLDRGGSAPTAPNDLGWKDTVMVNPFETVNVLVKFDAYDGVYLVHCHNLEHEDHGMMSNFMVDNGGSVKDTQTADTQLSVYPNPASDKTTITLLDTDRKKELFLFDTSGKVVLKEIIPDGLQTFQLNVSSLATGSYRVALGDRSAILTVIK